MERIQPALRLGGVGHGGTGLLVHLAKRLYNTVAGWWTLALAAVAPALVVYAQEARMYAAFFALAVATLYFACVFLR